MPGSSENFDLIIRARDEASATVGMVQQRLGGVTGQLANTTAGANLAMSAFRSLSIGLLGVGGTLGVLAVAMAGLREILSDKLHTIERLNEALDKNQKAITAVARGNDYLAGVARELNFIHAEMTRQTILETEAKIAAAAAGFKEVSIWERLVGALLSSSDAARILTSNFQQVGVPERQRELAELIGTLQKLRESLSSMPSFVTTINDFEQLGEAMSHEGLADGTAALRDVGIALRGIHTESTRVWRDWDAMQDAIVGITPEHHNIVEQWEEVSDSVRELQGIIQSGMVEASASIINTFLGVRANLAEIFKQMALDFERFFLSAIMQKAAFKLASAALAPTGILGFLGLGKPVAGGGAPVMPASAPRLATSAGTTVVVQIHGDIIGEEQYVRQRVIPQLKRAMEVGIPGPW